MPSCCNELKRDSAAGEVPSGSSHYAASNASRQCLFHTNWTAYQTETNRSNPSARQGFVDTEAAALAFRNCCRHIREAMKDACAHLAHRWLQQRLVHKTHVVRFVVFRIGDERRNRYRYG